MIVKSVIGIIFESENDRLKSYNGIENGDIFEKKYNVFYSVTESHVIDDKICNYKVVYIKYQIYRQNNSLSGYKFE